MTLLKGKHLFGEIEGVRVTFVQKDASQERVAFLKKLLSYYWPGNIRELENTIRSAIALSKTHYLTTYELKELYTLVEKKKEPTFTEDLSSALIPYVRDAIARKDKKIYEKILHEVDRSVLDYVLSHTKENQSEAARLLGINRLTIRKKLSY